jgi:DNA polymerase-3 subunit delta
VPVLNQGQLRTQLKRGDAASLYVLVGADDAEKASVAAEFGDLVDEGLRAFNYDRLYGGDMSVADLLQAANTLPMMVPRRIVIVLEAEKLLAAPKRESKAAEEEQRRLESFITDPPPHATVVFVAGGLDRRRRPVKLLLERATWVDCGTIEDAADAERWAKTRAAREGVTLDPGAVRVLVERGGNDLVRLRSALERVMLYALGQPTITADDVKQVVAPAPDAQEEFGIANAVQNGNAAAALRQLAAALEAGAAPYFLMGQLRWAAEKTPASRLRDAVDAVFRTDLALKSSGGDPRILLERLVVELAGMAGSGGRRPGYREYR